MSEELNSPSAGSGQVSSEQLSVDSDQLPVNSVEELNKLKEANQKQAAEIKELKKEVEVLRTPSSLRDNPPSQGQSHLNPKRDASATLKTQGIKPSRGDGMGVLHKAAKRAAHSNSRSDVQEYMRLRRSFV